VQCSQSQVHGSLGEGLLEESRDALASLYLLDAKMRCHVLNKHGHMHRHYKKEDR
jgi:hypothetical protein